MAIQGLRTTANFVTDQRPQNWRESILRLYPNGMAPLFALTSLMKDEKTDDPRFNWWEKALPSQRVALTATHTNVITTLTVASGDETNFRLNQLVLIEQTNEIVRVTADPSVAGAIPVQRGFGGTTNTAVAVGTAGVNPMIHVIGTAFEENSQAPTGMNYDPTSSYNFTQIWRNSLEMSRTAQKTRLRTGDQVKEAKREALELHQLEVEKALIWGVRYEGTLNGKPQRSTGGILSFIPAGNKVTVAGAGNVAMTDLEGWLYNVFNYGSSEKIAFAGNRALLAINQVVRKNSFVQITSGIKEYGMNVSRLVSPFGELVIKTHPLFNQLPGGTTSGTAYAGFDSSMLILDQANLRWRYIDDTQYLKDQQTPGLDGMKSGYLTEGGLEINLPLTHYFITNIQAGVTDA